MPKRKQTDDAVAEPPRRSSRVRASATDTKPVPLPEVTSKAKAASSTKAKAAAGKATAEKNADKPAETPAPAPADDQKWYWLMKAEPETRLENGTDVRFSIDDLKARTEPEPWDGKSQKGHVLYYSAKAKST